MAMYFGMGLCAGGLFDFLIKIGYLYLPSPPFSIILSSCISMESGEKPELSAQL